LEKNLLPYFDGLLAKWSGEGTLEASDPRPLAAYHASCNEPNRIHAFCEDYRAGATVDVTADEEDLRAGKTVPCPVLAVWGEFYLSRGSAAETDTTLDA
jgi:haloacetate dehalogenase